MTRTIRHTLVAGVFAALFSGCAGGNIPGMPGMGGSPTPAPGATPITATPVSGSDCTRDKPAAEPVKGGPAVGKYNGQSLPNGYDKYTTEAQVTEAIKKEDGGANWACFQKFYPGAVTVYQGLKSASPAPKN